jgi:hypothetical protein
MKPNHPLLPEPTSQAEDDRVPPGLCRGTPRNRNSLIVQFTPGGLPYLRSELEAQQRRSGQNGNTSTPRGTEPALDQGTEPRLARGTEPARGRGPNGTRVRGPIVSPP